ncbi:PspC domain-containing protein [Actinomyces dentalis]|uniref:PspC domain-containing protein n=1 Tax=Actinomyces dentalis TaxID=272548 RepID=UPI0023530E23|nr:PspC domain-containing protein [Actinomyces dentalis]
MTQQHPSDPYSADSTYSADSYSAGSAYSAGPYSDDPAYSSGSYSADSTYSADPYSYSADPYTSDPYSAGSYPPGSYSARTESWRTTLPRRSRRRLIAGVCGGLAEHWGVSPTLVRLATLLLALLPGPMWLVYAAAWIVMPDAD